MGKETLKVIKESDIANNCPECFNQDMKITFFQKHAYGKLYHRITNEITHKIQCKTCNSIIYPVNWTDDIERTFHYYQKMAAPEKASIKFGTLLYILVLMLMVMVAAGIYLYF
ncbi:MAG: hypothetical protein AAFX53_06855 [Bacteroidota bacterium]